MRAPVAVTSWEAWFSWLFTYAAKVGFKMFVHCPWYSRSTTSQRPASSTTTFGFVSAMAASHWYGHGWSSRARPA